MKKLLAIFALIAIFAACNSDADTTASEADATTVAVDSSAAASTLSADSATSSIDSAAAAIVDSARLKSAGALKGKKAVKK